MNNKNIILAIETSCDETAVAIMGERGHMLADIVLSQQEHEQYGGVVPELASRAHISALPEIVSQAFGQAGITPSDLTLIAATSGPGLIGGLIVGMMFAKSMAVSLGLPFIPVNHLEGHALSPMLESGSQLRPPFLLLLISGGHCQIIMVEDIGRYRVIGRTRDDSVGEAFDKTAKMMGLGYPGGPLIEKYAALGDASRFVLPFPLSREKSTDFSFSGLKTAVRRLVLDHAHDGVLNRQDMCDIAASFQARCADILTGQMSNALETLEGDASRDIVVAGGVAANMHIRCALEEMAASRSMTAHFPPLRYCTDNAAMIALAALKRYEIYGAQCGDIHATPRARWPLDE